MLRKHLLKDRPVAPAPRPGEKDIATIAAEGVTHVQLVIKPDKGHTPCRATLTTLACQ